MNQAGALESVGGRILIIRLTVWGALPLVDFVSEWRVRTEGHEKVNKIDISWPFSEV